MEFADRTVFVDGTNNAPTSADDIVSALEDTAVTLSVSDLTGNDGDFDGDALTIQSVTSGAGGTVVLDGNGDVLFTPDAEFNGQTTFTYTVSDGNGGTSTSSVTVDVAALNDAPVSAEDTVAG